MAGIRRLYVFVFVVFIQCAFLAVVQSSALDTASEKAKPVTNSLGKNWIAIAGGVFGGLLAVQFLGLLIGMCRKPGQPLSNNNRISPKDPEEDYYGRNNDNYEY